MDPESTIKSDEETMAVAALLSAPATVKAEGVVPAPSGCTGTEAQLGTVECDEVIAADGDTDAVVPESEGRPVRRRSLIPPGGRIPAITKVADEFAPVAVPRKARTAANSALQRKRSMDSAGLIKARAAAPWAGGEVGLKRGNSGDEHEVAEALFDLANLASAFGAADDTAGGDTAEPSRKKRGGGRRGASLHKKGSMGDLLKADPSERLAPSEGADALGSGGKGKGAGGLHPHPNGVGPMGMPGAGGWPGGMPMFYPPPGSQAGGPGGLPFFGMPIPHARPWKRCASHVYIAQFIDYQQKMSRFRVFGPGMPMMHLSGKPPFPLPVGAAGAAAGGGGAAGVEGAVPAAAAAAAAAAGGGAEGGEGKPPAAATSPGGGGTPPPMPPGIFSGFPGFPPPPGGAAGPGGEAGAAAAHAQYAQHLALMQAGQFIMPPGAFPPGAKVPPGFPQPPPGAMPGAPPFFPPFFAGGGGPGGAGDAGAGAGGADGKAGEGKPPLPSPGKPAEGKSPPPPAAPVAAAADAPACIAAEAGGAAHVAAPAAGPPAASIAAEAAAAPAS